MSTAVSIPVSANRRARLGTARCRSAAPTGLGCATAAPADLGCATAAPALRMGCAAAGSAGRRTRAAGMERASVSTVSATCSN